VVTQGAKGATLYCGGQISQFPSRPTELIEPTGAGDVFAAAFLVRLAETEDPFESTRFANVAASLSVEKAGLASVPQRADIEKQQASRQ
jgi:sugar/nucleoside kinase (ribokinase family)